MGKGLVILFVLVKYVEREMIRKYFSSLSHVWDAMGREVGFEWEVGFECYQPKEQRFLPFGVSRAWLHCCPSEQGGKGARVWWCPLPPDEAMLLLTCHSSARSLSGCSAWSSLHLVCSLGVAASCLLNSEFGNPIASMGRKPFRSTILQPKYFGITVCEYLYWKFTMSAVSKQGGHTLVLVPTGGLSLCCSCGCLAAGAFQAHLCS